jgi:hypothetical protein
MLDVQALRRERLQIAGSAQAVDPPFAAVKEHRTARNWRFLCISAATGLLSPWRSAVALAGRTVPSI